MSWCVVLLLGAAGAAAEAALGRSLKAEAVALLERVSRMDDVQLLPGVRLVRDGNSSAPGGGEVGAAAREHPSDVDARLDAYLARRAAVFLDTHALSIKLPDPASLLGWATDTQAGRAKNKGGKGMGLLLAAAGMMKAMLGALGVGAVALLAGKALMTGLLALMLAAIVGLKSLAGGGGKHVTYEIVSKPVVSHVDTHSHEVMHEHGHGHSSYGRSFDDAAAAASGSPHAYLPLTTPAIATDYPAAASGSPHAYLPLTAPAADTDYPSAATGPPHAYLPPAAEHRLHPVYQAASTTAPPPAETYHGGTRRYHNDFRSLTAPGWDLPAPNT